MEKKRGKWLIAVLILVLAAACAGGFYLVKSRSRQENGQFPGGGQMPGDIPGGQSTGITATGTAILKVSQDSVEEAGEELDTKLQEAQDAVTDAEADIAEYEEILSTNRYYTDYRVQELQDTYQEDYDLFCKFLDTYGITSVNVETGKFDPDQTQPPRDQLQVYQSFWKTIGQEAQELTQAKENYQKAQETLDELEDAETEAQENLDEFESLLGDGILRTRNSGDVIMVAYEAGTFDGIVTEINSVSNSSGRSSVTYTVTVTLFGDVSTLSANITARVSFLAGNTVTENNEIQELLTTETNKTQRTGGGDCFHPDCTRMTEPGVFPT